MFKYLDHIKDERVVCYSILYKIKISDYLPFIENVYKNQGGIEGQRSPLKTKSAQRIRRRLVEDLNRGTVIPPIVLGVKLDEAQFSALEDTEDHEIEGTMTAILQDLMVAEQPDKQKEGEAGDAKKKNDEQISIIDGMQRTTALFEAAQTTNFNGDRYIRLELWVARQSNSLIYRMLVLNTGQIPWNLRRQLDVVFSQLRIDLNSGVKGLELFKVGDDSKRRRPGQYQSSDFIELFILFGSKRIFIDIQDELAEEFARLDIIETSGNESSLKFFFEAAQLLVDIDTVFSTATAENPEIPLTRFKSGKDVFSSQTARAGFIVAIAQDIFGLPGETVGEEEQLKRLEKITSSLNFNIENWKKETPERLFEILDLSTLEERTNIKTAKVGEFERKLFLAAFKTLIELSKKGTLTNLTPCWSTPL